MEEIDFGDEIAFVEAYDCPVCDGTIFVGQTVTVVFQASDNEDSRPEQRLVCEECGPEWLKTNQKNLKRKKGL